MFETQDIFKALNILRQEYKCPISLQIMKNPVVDCEGISYQKANIEKWLQTSNVSPVTGNVMHSKSLIPNNHLENLIKKVETQIPVLFSFIQVLKTQINHLNLSNKRLESQRELNFGNSQVSEPQNHEGNKPEQMVHEEPKIYDPQNDKQSLKSVEINTEKEQKKVHKTKMIKKLKFERFYDSKMSENMKEANRNWEKHLQNLKVQQSQITNKFSESLKMKEEIIERSKETINEQSSRITELSKMVDESQKAPNQILVKIEDLSKEVMSVISKNLPGYPENIKEKYSEELTGVQEQAKNKEQKNNQPGGGQIQSNSELQRDRKTFQLNSLDQEKFLIASLRAQIEEYRQRLCRAQKSAFIQLTTTKNSYQAKLDKLVAESEEQKNKIKLFGQKVKERNVSSPINLSKKKQQQNPKNQHQQDQRSTEVEYWQMIFLRQFRETHQNWMLIIYALEHFIQQLLTYEELVLQQIQDQKQAQEQKLALQKVNNKKQQKYMRIKKQREEMQEQKQLQQGQKKSQKQSQAQNQNQIQKQGEELKLFTLVMEFIRKKKQQYNSSGLSSAFESIILANKSQKNYFLRAMNFYKKIQWTLTSLDKIPTSFISCLETYRNGVASGFGCGFKISFETLKKILIDLKETTIIWKELVCIYSDEQHSKSDKAWSLLVRFRYLFPNLLQIRLAKCSIEDIQTDDFSRWPLLSKLTLSQNPLTEKSKSDLEQYQIKNPKVKMIL